MDKKSYPVSTSSNQTSNNNNEEDLKLNKLNEIEGSISTSSPSCSKNDGLNVREKWATRRDFYLSCAGSFIGLGNVWRFPYLCYENGGAVFFVPYLTFLFLAGIPIFFLEVSVGQYTSEGGITAWTVLAPISTGIGWGSIVLTTVINTYYIVVLGWSLYYMFASMAPYEHLNKIWNTCSNEWNNNATCMTFSDKLDVIKNNATEAANLQKMYPIEEYWENKVLGISDEMTFETLTDINWTMFATVALAWVVCYFCVWRGLGWTSKVVMFTATFPVFMLLVLLIRGVTLDGAMKGIEFYMIPKSSDWAKLWAKDGKIWLDAGTQVLYSYALCKGALLSLGSYNKYKTNCYKDVFMLSACNSGVSFISGFAIFSVLGFMANAFGVEVKDVAKSGPGLAFIAFPQAILEMPGEWTRPLWAVAFFFMIFLLGLDSQFVGLEAVATSFIDMYPSLRRPGRREIFIAAIVAGSLILAIPMCGSGGIYLFKLYDYYGASGFCLLFLCACECLAVAYLYGIDKFWRNVKSMLGFYPSKYTYYCWMFVTPVLCIFLTSIKIINFESLVYKRPLVNKEYTKWEESVGWFLASLSMLPVFIFGIGKPLIHHGKFLTSKQEIKENFYHSCQPKDQKIQHIVFDLNRSPDDPNQFIESSFEGESSNCKMTNLDGLSISSENSNLEDKSMLARP